MQNKYKDYFLPYLRILILKRFRALILRTHKEKGKFQKAHFSYLYCVIYIPITYIFLRTHILY